MIRRVCLMMVLLGLLLASCTKESVDIKMPNVTVDDVCDNVQESFSMKNFKITFMTKDFSILLAGKSDTTADIYAVKCIDGKALSFPVVESDNRRRITSTIKLGTIQQLPVMNRLQTHNSNLFDIAFDGNNALVFDFSDERKETNIVCDDDTSCISFVETLQTLTYSDFRKQVSVISISSEAAVKRSFLLHEDFLATQKGNQDFLLHIETERRLMKTMKVLNSIDNEFNTVLDMKMNPDLLRSIVDASIWYSCYDGTCINHEDSTDVIAAKKEWIREGIFAIAKVEDVIDAKDTLFSADYRISLDDFPEEAACNTRGVYNSKIGIFQNGNECYGSEQKVLAILHYTKKENHYVVHALKVIHNGSDRNPAVLTKNGSWLAMPNDYEEFKKYVYENPTIFTLWEFELLDNQDRLFSVVSARVISHN